MIIFERFKRRFKVPGSRFPVRRTEKVVLRGREEISNNCHAGYFSDFKARQQWVSIKTGCPEDRERKNPEKRQARMIRLFLHDL
jgi:hypothetical protein